MSLRINDEAPDFTANSTQGEIRFHDWLSDSWGILFSHPKDFTPVCTTELGQLARMENVFAQHDCKLIGLSVDTVEDHQAWKADISKTQGVAVNFPIIADSDMQVAQLYGMLPANETGAAGERSAADNATVRTVFVIGPDKKIKLMLSYPMSTGRNFHEILRVLQSLQLTAKYKVATPANWEQGEEVIIVPSLSDDEARNFFPEGWRSETDYLRYVPQPAP